MHYLRAQRVLVSTLVSFVASAAVPLLAQGQDTPTTPVQQTQSNQEEKPTEKALRIEETQVTGERDATPFSTGYLPEQSSTGSNKLDVPIREQANVIQIVPRTLIEDRGAISVHDALETAVGVRPVSPAYSSGSAGIRSRGFETEDTFVNGTRLGAFGHPLDTANIEQLEVLKGPASIQYGLTEPGGVLNIVTKRPVAERLLNFRTVMGSFDSYRGEVDVGGAVPGTGDRLLTRFNFAYEDSDGFRDFDEQRRIFVAPAFTWHIGENTTLDFELNYLHNKYRFNRGLPPQRFILDLPFRRSLMEPNQPLSTNDSYSFFYNFEHRFGESGWKVRQRLGYLQIDSDTFEINTGVSDVDANGTIERSFFKSFGDDTYWTLQNELVGEFKTGSIAHKGLIGFEVSRTDFGYDFYSPIDSARNPPPLNVFKPVYGGYKFPRNSELSDGGYPAEHYGHDIVALYLDYQLKPWKQLILLGGMRFDWTSGFYEPLKDVSGYDPAGLPNYAAADSFGFSPRAGIVYTPIPSLDLFFNYSTAFKPNLFADSAGTLFDDPEESEQFEGGLRYELVPEHLRATLAGFSITKQNVQVPDPNDPTGRRSLLNGEQSSDGFEFELVGQAYPGWDLVLGYSYYDARITKDTDPTQVGTALVDAPQNHVALWTKYEFQSGLWRNLWAGYGLAWVDNRRSSFANADFSLPSYVRHDIGVGYTRGAMSAQINFGNLTDERIYYTHGNNIHLQPPLDVVGSLRLRF